MWRKSWPKLNIFGKNGDGVCSKRNLSISSRALWDDYLDLAALSPIRGKICLSINIGYTQEQLAEILRFPLDLINQCELNLLEYKMIDIKNNRVIDIINWKSYQSEYDRQLPYRVTRKGYKKKLQKKVTKNPSILFSSILISNIKDFFGYFLLKTKKEFKLTEANQELIGRRLKEGYTIEQLKKAVDNFIQDDWPERTKHLDLIYCIGKQKGKPDALEKWLNYKPQIKPRQP